MGALRKRMRELAHQRGEIQRAHDGQSAAEKRRLRRERKSAEINRRRAETLRAQQASSHRREAAVQDEQAHSTIEFGRRIYVFTDDGRRLRWYAQAESRRSAEYRIRASGYRGALHFVGSEAVA